MLCIGKVVNGGPVELDTGPTLEQRLERGTEMGSIKACTKCGKAKPTDEFGKDRTRQDGLFPQCKSCRRAYYNANRERELERYRQNYIKNADKKRAYARKYRSEHREYYLERSRAYSLTPKETKRRRLYQVKNRNRLIGYHKEYRRDNPHVVAAGSAVLAAVRRGDLPPVSECDCFMCGKPATVYHHVDYSKPLEVFPVCHSCHGRWHAANERVR